jgi:hypothetical protein
MKMPYKYRKNSGVPSMVRLSTNIHRFLMWPRCIASSLKEASINLSGHLNTPNKKMTHSTQLAPTKTLKIASIAAEKALLGLSHQ